MTEHATRQLIYMPVSELKPDPNNPRKHSPEQIAALAKSMNAFGINAPILTDKRKKVLAGHGRLEAAKSLGIEQVPVICLDDLSEEQVIADNRLAERSCWDDRLLAVHLQELSGMALEFDIEATGFELPEIDLRIQSLETVPKSDPEDVFEIAAGPPVSRPGDLWFLGIQRLYCGNALDQQSFDMLMGGAVAAAVFTDPPYNVKINGHVSGLGSVHHREFAMASGEMGETEFTSFLTRALELSRQNSSPGAVLYTCMDFRHMAELLAAGRANSLELLNLCVWVKTNGGLAKEKKPEDAEGMAVPLPGQGQLMKGAVLVREHEGQQHHVMVTEDGFVWSGTAYPSLTKVAFAITGTKWNGPRFFGLRKKIEKKPS